MDMKWKENWQIGLILFVALLVRLWGINFGLPYAHHIDEPRYIYAAVGMWQEQTLNPGWFHQPTLYTYLIALAIGGYYVLGRVMGIFDTTADLFRPTYHFNGYIPFPAEFLLARLVTVVFALATIWVVYKIGQKWFSEASGLISAAFLSLSIFHVTSSHFIATDVPVGLFIMLTLYFCIRVAEEGNGRDYLWMGICAGLAVGTKYSAWVLVIPGVLAHLMAWQRGYVKLVHKELVGTAVLAAITLFLTTPYAVFDNTQFTADLRYEWEHHKLLGHVGAEGNSGIWLMAQLLTGSDRWLTLLAIAGFSLALWRRHWPLILIFSFALIYFFSMASNLVRFERFLVPLIPVLSVGAGYVWHEMRNRFSLTFHLSILIPLLLLLEPAISVAQFDARLARTEARTLAREWIVANIPAGNHIALERYAPDLSQANYVTRKIDSLNKFPLEWYRAEGFDYLVFAEAQYGIPWRNPEQYADLIEAYEVLWDNLEFVIEFEGPYVGRPDHKVIIYRVSYEERNE